VRFASGGRDKRLSEVERCADRVLRMPETHERMSPVLANVQLQLVAYHMVERLSRLINKPFLKTV
jgi:glucosamine--fructose-6-phosphate aminotransferase (isomerizing)